MKKYFSIAILLSSFTMLLSAQVYYLLPNSDGWNSEDVTNVYDNLTYEDQDPKPNQLQWEDPYQPERQAYEWFKDYYQAGAQKVITYKDLTDGRLNADGNLFSSVRVLWIHVDRYMDKTTFDALFPQEVRDAIARYVKAGGNVYLSTYAVRLLSLIGRGPESGFAENNGFNEDTGHESDPWKVLANFGEGMDNSVHFVYKYLKDNNQYGKTEITGKDYDCFNMQSGVPFSDRNCLWDIDDNVDAINVFQNEHSCRILGSWGHASHFTSAGLVEFYPTGDWKGTIIANGLAACSWSSTNTSQACVQFLTRGVLDYLNKRPESTWDSLEKTLIRIGGGFDNALSLQNPPSAEDYTIKYYSNDVSIANVLEDGMGVYGNYFGKVTFRAEMQGNGLTAPKNLWTIHSPELTVDGSAPAEFGYVLPYSLHTMSEYSGVNEEGYRPDFVSADWFNQEYVLEPDRGCFINPKEYNADNPIPDEVKVLWIHNDHVGLSSEDYFTALGRENFVAALRAFVERGGHLFLSKQATRLVGDLHLLGQIDANNYAYPGFQNGGYSSDTSDPWSIKYDYTYDGNHKDYSTHPVYTGFTAYPQIQTNSKRTNNNFLLFENLDTYEDYQSKENEYKCRLLGCWANGQNPYQGGIFAEFLPRTAGNGTIIMMGAAAYHWTGFIVDDINGDLTNLTTNILAYLHGIDADTYVRPVTASRYGTICLPKASASITGAEIYRIIDQDTEGVVIEQVTTMEAGKPYFFYATSNTLTIKMQGERASLSPNNGLIGHADFEGKTLTIPQGSDKYILYDNMLYYVNSDVQLPCNYAYVDGSAITTLQAMPGMKRCIMATPGKGNAPTSLDNITNETVAPQKLMIDGKIYILRDGHIYSILGEHVK